MLASTSQKQYMLTTNMGERVNRHSLLPAAIQVHIA